MVGVRPPYEPDSDTLSRLVLERVAVAPATRWPRDGQISSGQRRTATMAEPDSVPDLRHRKAPAAVEHGAPVGPPAFPARRSVVPGRSRR